MNLSPGVLGLYWALATYTATGAWIAACEITRRAARR